MKNPDYYLKDKDGRQLPYVDAVRLVFTKDASTETALFRTKQLDIMRVSTLDLLYALMKTVPDLSLYRVPSLGWGDYGLSLAVDKAPFNDVRVRQALSMAINRDVSRRSSIAGDATLYGPFPWVMAGYTKRADYSYANLGPNYQYNPKKAKELLAAAGYPERASTGARVGRVPGLHLRRVRAAPVALLRRRRRAREAQAARDVHVARQGRRRAAVHPRARLLQPDRGGPELHGLGVPALPLVVARAR